MRIVLYNILDGAQDNPTRLTGILDWVASQQADVAGLVELNGWQQPPGIGVPARAAGFGHAQLLVGRSRYLVGLMAREPIELLEEITEGVHHGILHVRSAGVHYVVSHFAPHDRDMRVREARRCAAIVRAAGEEPLVLMGDLNSHSPADAALCESFATPENRAWAMDFEPQRILLDAGLIDTLVLDEPRWTVATALKPDEPRRHLDYIYVNPAFHRRHPAGCARVQRGEPLARLSDHWPVVYSSR